MRGVKPFIVFSVFQLFLLGNPCDGQFHWGKNYRLEANTLANLLLGNEDSVDENLKVSLAYNRLTSKKAIDQIRAKAILVIWPPWLRDGDFFWFYLEYMFTISSWCSAL